jgi:prevent-host-death family protein
MDQIGVRELRQHASRYLARVVGGETIEVTDRGRPVALLVPVTADTWSDMIAARKVALATDDADIADEAPADYGIDASSALAAMRADER